MPFLIAFAAVVEESSTYDALQDIGRPCLEQEVAYLVGRHACKT
jgi:hypothetical protein